MIEFKRRLAAVVIVLSLSLSGFIPVRANPPLQSASESTIFLDDFESYQANTPCSQAGWEVAYGGTSSSLQNHMITASVAYAGSKSLQLDQGSIVLKMFTTDADTIGYEFAFMGPMATAQFTATSMPTQTLGKYELTSVAFKGDAAALDGDNYVSLGSFQPQQWQTVRVVLDRTSNTYDVWINGVLKTSSLHTHGPETRQIDSLELSGSGPAYIDNVRVFGVSATPPCCAPNPYPTAVILLGIVLVVAAVAFTRIRRRQRRPRANSTAEGVATHAHTATKLCISCRTELPIDAKFCDNCGAGQP